MNVIGRWARHPRAAAVLGFLVAVAAIQRVGGDQLSVPHRQGQGVVPVYDGYEPNDDGTVTLWFGYLNRNYEEVLDIPVGPDNTFGKPKADRGQPTYFQPRRKKTVFSVVVPEAEARSVRWSLTLGGRTEVAVATILPTSIISRRRGTVNSLSGVPPNTPPKVEVHIDKHTLSLSDAAIAKVSATDDGYPKRNAAGMAIKPGLTVRWSKFRGPGKVTFEPESGRIPDGGPLATKLMFGEPGDYTLLAVVDDGSSSFGEYCCWTNATVKVSVRR